MTITTEILRDFDPDPEAAWPERCPSWCEPHDPHRPDDDVLDRIHTGVVVYVDLSTPCCPNDEQWIAVNSRQAAGRAPSVELSVGGRTVLLTGREATVLSAELVKACEEAATS